MTDRCGGCLREIEPYKVTTSATWIRAYYKCASCDLMWLAGWGLDAQRVVTK